MPSVLAKESPRSNSLARGRVCLLWRKARFFSPCLYTKDMISSKIQTPFQGKMSGVGCSCIIIYLQWMLMGPWPWRGDCHGPGCPADTQQHQLKLGFISAGKISLFWEKLLWEIKGSSCCHFRTHFWLRMTSRDLNHKEKGKHSTISASWKEPLLWTLPCPLPLIMAKIRGTLSWDPTTAKSWHSFKNKQNWRKSHWSWVCRSTEYPQDKHSVKGSKTEVQEK